MTLTTIQWHWQISNQKTVWVWQGRPGLVCTRLWFMNIQLKIAWPGLGWPASIDDICKIYDCKQLNISILLTKSSSSRGFQNLHLCIRPSPPPHTHTSNSQWAKIKKDIYINLWNWNIFEQDSCLTISPCRAKKATSQNYLVRAITWLKMGSYLSFICACPPVLVSLIFVARRHVTARWRCDYYPSGAIL